ncbi:pathogen-related protein-like [Magnolia sinica]|uniref:pathogen-related protein-like n=1 Tax=Magnolia sinica TaxID=86752 RepID=UPI00265B0D40|nr:pathogen-related protein-like [Magnolia sinica]
MASSLTPSETVVGDKYRYHIYGEGEKNTIWKYGAPPNYDVVNKLFEEGRTKEWPKGSLEEKVQNFVKTWEMEIFHKIRVEDFKTINPHKYTLSLNGRPSLSLEGLIKLGGYNVLLQTALPENLRGYDPTVETSESSHKAFTTTFPRGFALEIVHVYSGPPVIVYKFRHWAFMEGPFKGHAPTGEMIQFHGVGIFQVDEAMKLEKVEFFYDSGELLGGLLNGPAVATDASEASGNSTLGCPFLDKKF